LAKKLGFHRRGKFGRLGFAGFGAQICCFLLFEILPEFWPKRLPFDPAENLLFVADDTEWKRP
jgi:hypothetical protein